MGLAHTDIEALITLAKTGKQSAYKKLLDEYWSYIYGFQLKRTSDEFLAEDITIQTFAKAFDKLSTYNSDYKFKTWLTTISKNIHVDIIRKENNAVVTNTSAEDELIKEQNLSLLLQNIKKLKPDYQNIIMLRYFQELSYKEIAETIDEPINTIKVKLLRARKLLADIITSGTNKV